MGYDRGESFPLDFGPNGIPFGSKSNDHIQFNLKGNNIRVFSLLYLVLIATECYVFAHTSTLLLASFYLQSTVFVGA